MQFVCMSPEVADILVANGLELPASAGLPEPRWAREVTLDALGVGSIEEVVTGTLFSPDRRSFDGPGPPK